MNDIVIIGGGHAGVQLCSALVAAGQGARVHLVCEESDLPYQRPPLSKSFQKNPNEELQLHRARSWFSDNGIQLHLRDPAGAVDVTHRCVSLTSGTQLPFEWLVLATGTRARTLPALHTGLSNVFVLRTAADAKRLRGMWGHARHLTVLGGGFIGLEVAAAARSMGKAVHVIETAPRLMQRSVSAELSEHALAVHRANGVDIRLGAAIGGYEVQGERLISMDVDGQAWATNQLLLGIGASPEITLASAAGLHCENGVVVDAYMQTSAPQVLAIGDCANFPEAFSGQHLRLESVQNANDQAKTAAATILGLAQQHRALAWFWSEQGAMRLQMAGLIPAGAKSHRRDGATPASFSILHYVDERLACVESVNAPADHLAARKLLELGCHPAPALACDPAKPLKLHLP